jgi:hypothetical protein
VEEAVPSRRPKSKLGDFSFSVCAAALGIALLFAAGRHLFASPPVTGLAQPATVSVARMAHDAVPVAAAVPAAVTAPAAVAVPAANRVPRASPFGVPAARNRRAAAVTTVRRGKRTRPASQVARASRGEDVRHALGALLRNGVPHGRDSAKTRLHQRLAVALTAHPARSAATAQAARPAPMLHPRFTVAARAVSGAKARAPALIHARGIHRANVHPRSAPGRVIRSVVARATFGASHRSVAQTSRAANRVRAMRQRAVIEPPLGYEAQPALVLAPAAVALDLGAPVIPAVRSRRRH